MGVFKRKGSSFYTYDFWFQKQRYTGSTETKLLHEARAVEVKVRQQIEEDAKAGREGVKRLTLQEVADKWLESARIAHSDWQNDESRVRKLFGRTLAIRFVDGQRTKVEEQATYVNDRGETVPRFALSPSLQLQELSQGLLLQLRDARHAEGNTPATINREMALVQSLVAYAKDALKAVTPNPPLVFSAKRAQAHALKLKEPEGKLRFLTEAEEVELLTELWRRHEEDGSQRTLDNFDLTVFLLDTGARYHEVALLTVNVLDMKRREVDLYRGKGGRSSRLAMTDRLHAVLEARLEKLEGRRYIFPGYTGHAWSREDVPRGHATGGIQGAIDRVGINDPVRVQALGRATPHTFRDTFASRLIQNGFTLYEVQALLGHASPAMTQKYAKLLVTQVSSRASATLNKLSEQSYPWKRTPAVPALPIAVPALAQQSQPLTGGLVEGEHSPFVQALVEGVGAKLPVEEDPSSSEGPITSHGTSGPITRTDALEPAVKKPGSPCESKTSGLDHGGPCRIRTYDQRIKSPLLYQLS
jgi:integrase